MLNRDRDVFASLHSNNCRYVVLGGVAAVPYGVPRLTFDIDILIDASEANAENVLTALRESGFGTAHLITGKELLANKITIFTDRARIDIQTATPGLVFEEAWRQRRSLVFETVPFYVVSLDDLIRSKTAAGLPVDLSEVEQLSLKSSYFFPIAISSLRLTINSVPFAGTGVE